MSTTRLAVLLVLTVGVADSCKGPANTKQLPPELIVVEAAESVRVESLPNGRITVRYRLHQTFPADPLVTRIRAAMPASTWTPLAEDWMNPGMRAEPVWGSFEDGTKQPNELVHVWSAKWRDASGDVVEYELTYRSRRRPTDKWDLPPDDTALQVQAVWFPATVVKALRDELGISGPLK